MSVESTLLYLSSHQACLTRGTSCLPAYAPAAAFVASASHPPVAVRSGVRWRRWRSRRWQAWREIFLDVTTASPTWLRRNSRDLLMWAQFFWCQVLFWFHLQCDLNYVDFEFSLMLAWLRSIFSLTSQFLHCSLHLGWPGIGRMLVASGRIRGKNVKLYKPNQYPLFSSRPVLWVFIGSNVPTFCSTLQLWFH